MGLIRLGKLYLHMGAQSMCGLYFIPNDKVLPVLEKVKKDRNPDIADIIVTENNFFLLTVDFDFHGWDRDGEIYYRQLFMGDNLDQEIKQTLEREK